MPTLNDQLQNVPLSRILKRLLLLKSGSALPPLRQQKDLGHIGVERRATDTDHQPAFKVLDAGDHTAAKSPISKRTALNLGLDVGGLVNTDLCLGLDVKLPLGISIASDGCLSRALPEEL